MIVYRLSTTNVTQSEAFTSCQPDETTELTSTTVDYSYGMLCSKKIWWQVNLLCNLFSMGILFEPV